MSESTGSNPDAGYILFPSSSALANFHTTFMNHNIYDDIFLSNLYLNFIIPNFSTPDYFMKWIEHRDQQLRWWARSTSLYLHKYPAQGDLKVWINTRGNPSSGVAPGRSARVTGEFQSPVISRVPGPFPFQDTRRRQKTLVTSGARFTGSELIQAAAFR